MASSPRPFTSLDKIAVQSSPNTSNQVESAKFRMVASPQRASMAESSMRSDLRGVERATYRRPYGCSTRAPHTPTAAPNLPVSLDSRNAGCVSPASTVASLARPSLPFCFWLLALSHTKRAGIHGHDQNGHTGRCSAWAPTPKPGQGREVQTQHTAARALARSRRRARISRAASRQR